VLVRRWFAGDATVACTAPAAIASQPWAVGFRVAEHTWMTVPAVLVAILGRILVPTPAALRSSPVS
jgi:hypothetical protein